MYTSDGKYWIASADANTPIYLCPQMANRHGLVAGATGTGKTVSIKVMAETFSDAGVPVFIVDIKGDVSGLAQEGTANKHVDAQLEKCGVSDGFSYRAFPVEFWDVFGEKGIPVRATVSAMGPELISRLLGLNQTQQGVLDIVFRYADDKQLLLIDLKDLRSMIQYVSEHAKEIQTDYGNVTSQSAGAIIRSLIALEDAAGDKFFGEPDLEIKDWVRLKNDGKGIINIMDCVKLANEPLLYSTFLLWLMTDLYETFPEAGDLDKPRMVFFFDEAHLLFKDAPKALLDKIEQVVRLIRSKGIGIYFITQSPSDIPETVLAQLGNRVQHALRAFTPTEQKAVKTAAQTFRPNPAFDTEEAISVLGTGEALVSFLDEEGAPNMVQRAFILPPESLMEPCGEDVRSKIMNGSDLFLKYGDAVDNESAYEDIQKLEQEQAEAEQKAKEEAERAKEEAKLEAEKAKEEARKEREKEKEEERKERQKEREHEAASRRRKNAASRVLTNTISQIGREFGRNIMRGIFGNMKR